MFGLSCHCGKVTLTVEADAPTEAMSCNCSHCRRKGLLLAFFPRDQVRLDSGEGDLASYLFNKHAIEHRFCTACGCQPFAEGKMPNGAPVRAVNLRCAPDIALETLAIQEVDGASY
jgi:hypothetical protein